MTRRTLQRVQRMLWMAEDLNQRAEHEKDPVRMVDLLDRSRCILQLTDAVMAATKRGAA